MSPKPSRRVFLQTAATAGSALGLGEWSGLLRLSPVAAEEVAVTPGLVRFGRDIEPIVKLIEETPREKCVEVFIEQLRQGLPHRQFLAALYLAAIRAAKWHGGVHGYDHSAYVVHSAHQLSLDLPGDLRLLPAFYALEGFKGGQQAYPNKPGTQEFTGALPAASKATDELHTAMREWEPDRAERAIVAMVRTQGTAAVLEPLWHYAGRDFGFIGHMAILVSNSCRLLETIGWQHAEHVLRYVVAALAGWGKAHADDPDVKPYWANLKRIEQGADRLPGDWAGSKADEGLTKELVAAIRQGNNEEAYDLALRQMIDGKAQAGAIWDTVHLVAAELMLGAQPKANSQRNGDALHANTAANALHYAYRMSTVPNTRLLLTLQALSWMNLYHELLQKKKLLDKAMDITTLTGAELPESSRAAIDEILAIRTAQPQQAARLAFGLAHRPQGQEQLLRAARELIALKASGDPHDIKFPVAIFEDLDQVSAQWRPPVLAAAVFSFWGSDRPDNLVMQKVREAVQKL